jgi:hypothetical protein
MKENRSIRKKVSWANKEIISTSLWISLHLLAYCWHLFVNYTKAKQHGNVPPAKVVPFVRNKSFLLIPMETNQTFLGHSMGEENKNKVWRSLKLTADRAKGKKEIPFLLSPHFFVFFWTEEPHCRSKITTAATIEPSVSSNRRPSIIIIHFV